MRRIIEVTNEDRAFLEKAFNVTSRMVGYALTFDPTRGQSDLANKIRTLALKRGAKIVNMIPECEVFHDADGHMRQYFGLNIVIDVEKNTGNVVLMNRGKQVASWNNISISELELIQKKAKVLIAIN